jgi:hypothetical protein
MAGEGGSVLIQLKGRAAQAFDLAGVINTVGAPVGKAHTNIAKVGPPAPGELLTA